VFLIIGRGQQMGLNFINEKTFILTHIYGLEQTRIVYGNRSVPLQRGDKLF